MKTLPGMAAIFMALAACSTSSVTSVSHEKFYAVKSDAADFFRYGPQQRNGPDQKLTRNTLLTVVQPSFGYSKVQLMSGEQGYVAAEDIAPASPSLIAAVTAPPTRHGLTFPLNSRDPRLLTPPPPLPVDLPEPTPIPANESSPPPP